MYALFAHLPINRLVCLSGYWYTQRNWLLATAKKSAKKTEMSAEMTK